MSDTNPVPPIPDKLAVLMPSLENERRIIAAGKLQRWEMAKWAVTANIALTAASVALIPKDQSANFRGEQAVLAGLTVIVAAVGYGLMRHFNVRMTKAREVAWFLENEIDKVSGISAREVTHQSKEKPSFQYDNPELFWYALIFFISVVPAVSISVWMFLALCGRSL